MHTIAKATSISRPLIGLIASDIDGTLLDSNHQLPLLTEQGLQKISSKSNIPIMLATGKTLFASKNLLDKLHFLNDTFGAFLNGAIVVKKIGQADDTNINTSTNTSCRNTISIPGYIIYHEECISPQSALWFLNKCIKEDITIAVYSYDSIFTPFEYTEKHKPFFDYIHAFHEPTIQISSTLVKDITNGSLIVHKVMFLTQPSERNALGETFSKSPGFPSDVYMFPTMPEMLEVLVKGASKAKAIKVVCEEIGVSIGNVMSFGDGTNDFEMIRETGWGVAMENGIQSLKDIAKDVCGTNDGSGVPEYIMKYLEME